LEEDETLTPEKSIFWRVFCSVLHAEKKDDQLESILPEISTFCDVIKRHLGNDFVVKQLVSMCRYFDFADEVGRRNLSYLLSAFLPPPLLLLVFFFLFLSISCNAHK
jgi:hypothetical protein